MLHRFFQNYLLPPGFSAFSEARRHYFEQHRLDVDYESASASSSIGLDPQASHIFNSCIYGMALAGNYGLSAYGASEDETTATVQLFWKPTEAGKPVVIDDSTVDNANVVGETAGKLFPKKYSIRDAKTQTLKRIDPDKPITITLDESLDVTLAYLKTKDAESEEAQEHANSSA